MKFVTAITAAVLTVGLFGAPSAIGQTATPASIAAAVANPARPEADTVRDVLRKPTEMLVFAGVHPGEKIGEILPGGGYFTRLFSAAVGSGGHVYAIIPPANPQRAPAVRALAADPIYANVSVIEGPLGSFATPEPVDLVWTSQNYHDIADANRPAVNAAAFAALKSGGIYIVLDHSAAPGSGPTNSLHRMDEAVARTQIEAAGFVFVESSDVLRNPADDRSVTVFDGDTRGHTDQFILKYRKP